MLRTGVVSPFTGSIPRHREYYRSTYANVARIHDEHDAGRSSTILERMLMKRMAKRDASLAKFVENGEALG